MFISGLSQLERRDNSGHDDGPAFWGLLSLRRCVQHQPGEDWGAMQAEALQVQQRSFISYAFVYDRSCILLELSRLGRVEIGNKAN